MNSVNQKFTFEDVASFLSDLCTPAEMAMLEQRWRIANLVHMGFPYRVVIAKTGASSGTIARVSIALKTGTGKLREACDLRIENIASEKRPQLVAGG